MISDDVLLVLIVADTILTDLPFIFFLNEKQKTRNVQMLPPLYKPRKSARADRLEVSPRDNS